ncbi:MAG: MopE-related protein, partial [Bradymonadia bacterium]
NDNNAAVNPGAAEILRNGIDDDCNPATNDLPDADGDGFYEDTDCDDSNANVNPDAVEIPGNGLDDDCDSSTFDGPDNDSDGYDQTTDCDDANAAVNPGADEIVGNGIDDDCDPNTLDIAVTIVETNLRRGVNGYDGVTDVHVSRLSTTYIPENTGNFGANTVLRIAEDGQRQLLMKFELEGVPPLAVIDSANIVLNIESISYIDNPQIAVYPMSVSWIEGTCESQYGCVPNGATHITRGPGLGDWATPGGDYGAQYAVVDAPESGSVSVPVTDLARNWASGAAANNGVMLRGVRQWSNDFRITSSESANEALRPQLSIRWYLPPGVTDGDGDGFDADVDCNDAVAAINPDADEILGNGIDDDCDPGTDDTPDLDGDGFDFLADCDDDNAAVNPDADEVLLNGIDDDCNPATSDFPDADGDGFTSDVDCNDARASVNPDADEVLLNGIDDDCDPATSDFPDADGDGYTSDVDCDDSNASVNPGANEVMNNTLDDDCDPSTFDGADDDGDGYDILSDCNDYNANVNPAAVEIIDNGLDDDCDPSTLDYDVVTTTTTLRRGLNGYDGVGDTFLSSVSATGVPENTGNFGGAEEMRVSNDGVRNALIKFDVSEIPRLAVIEEAFLTVNIESLNYPSDDPSLSVFRIYREWDEGTCVNQYVCQADGATSFSRGVNLSNWINPNGDIAERISVTSTPSSGKVDLPVTSLVADWVAGNTANYGMMVRGEILHLNDYRLSSSEAGTATNRPTLTVRWHMPPLLAPGTGALAPRQENTTCKFPEVAGGPVQKQQIYLGLGLDWLVWIDDVPGMANYKAGVGLHGKIWLVENGLTMGEPVDFLDLPQVVWQNSPEDGLLSMAFHPDYQNNGRFFVSYTVQEPLRVRLSEYTRDPNNPMQADPNSERILLEIEKDAPGHNGGDLEFGLDGYMYMTVGDTNGGEFSAMEATRPSNLKGTVIRIDVDNYDAGAGEQYGIPPDNPFAAGDVITPWDDAPARPEVWAYGFRHPWRMSIDRLTGDVWIGDVGGSEREEVNKILPGLFYGWGLWEGDLCDGSGPQECPTIDDGAVQPVYWYDHSQGACIIGGHVYRGDAIPELFGAYVYGDCSTGDVVAVWFEEDELGVATAVATEKFFNVAALVDMQEDEDGELVVVSMNAGRHGWRLIVADDQEAAEPFPQLLSETGCFTDTATMETAAGVVPYALNAPLWSDDADKGRYLALPENGKATYTDKDAFGFPKDTVLIKSFFIDEVGRQEQRRLETRFMIKRADSWEAYTYKWNADQTDAELVAEEGAEETIETPDGPLVWNYPSRSACFRCHNEAANFAIGLSVRQLNRDVEIDGQMVNQLDAFAGIELVDLPTEAANLPAWPSYHDDSYTAGERARGLLHTNCATCHRPGTTVNTTFDLRGYTPFADMNICDAEPVYGTLGLQDARIFNPGDADNSVMFSRVSRRDSLQMPPLATRIVHGTALDLIRTWIEETPVCE